jgi:hypothetical protein
MAGKKGFLLIEILVALLVCMSFSLVIGFYLNTINEHHVLALKRLQALPIMQELIELLKKGQTLSVSRKDFSVLIEPVPLNIVWSNHELILPRTELITITLKWFDGQIVHTILTQTIIAQKL